MKKIRVTYNYHSRLHDKNMRFETEFVAGDFEAEDCLQEFDLRSNHFQLYKESEFILLTLLSWLCTGLIFLAGDVPDTQDHNNIHCLTDVEVLE